MTDERRIVLLAISPRIPAGLLSLEAWALLTSGAPVLHGEDHAILPWLTAADVDLTRLDSSVPDQAAALLSLVADGGTCVWLLGPDGDVSLSHELAMAALHGGGGVSIETMPGAWDPPGARLLDVVAIMDRLRSPGGCPWDAEQTHESLARYLVEEAYEALDAIHAADADHLRDELGDVLLQVAFHARVAQERDVDDGGFTIDDVAAGLVEKLVRRHPHVFADVTVADAGEVNSNWEAIKAAEPQPDRDPASEQTLAQVLDVIVRRARKNGLDPEVALESALARIRQS